MLAAIGLNRAENVYICNVLKCRPPGNRNPEAEEVAKCTPHLTKQIALIQPKLIIAMGRFAAQTLLNSDASIASLRGRHHQYAGLPLIVTYHRRICCETFRTNPRPGKTSSLPGGRCKVFRFRVPTGRNSGG
jgi:uracil-DNA glycosylase family 4